MKNRVKFYKQAVKWVKAAEDKLDPNKTYSLDTYNAMGIEPNLKSNIFSLQEARSDAYNQAVLNGIMFGDREKSYIPQWRKSSHPMVYDYAEEQQRDMHNRFRNVVPFVPKITQKEYADQTLYWILKGASQNNPAFDFKIEKNPNLSEESPTGYSYSTDKIYINNTLEKRSREFIDSMLAHEGTHGAVEHIINAAHKAHGYDRLSKNNRPDLLFDAKNNPLDWNGTNIRYNEWPSTVVGSTFTLQTPSFQTGNKNNIDLIATTPYADILRDFRKTNGTYKKSKYNSPMVFWDGVATTINKNRKAYHFPATPMRYAVNNSGRFEYDKGRDQVLYNINPNPDPNDKNTTIPINKPIDGELSTMPANAYNAYTNLKDVPVAWDEFKVNPHEYLEMMENTQRALRPLYAQSKPFVYLAGDYDAGFDKNNKRKQKVDRALTVSQLVNGSLDPINGSAFRKLHQDEIRALQPELRRRLEDIKYPSENGPMTREQYDKATSQFYADFPEYMNPGLIGAYPEGLTDIQYEHSITPGFDMPSDIRTMEQMQDIIDHIQYIYNRQRTIDNFDDPRGINRDWA